MHGAARTVIAPTAIVVVALSAIVGATRNEPPRHVTLQTVTLLATRHVVVMNPSPIGPQLSTYDLYPETSFGEECEVQKGKTVTVVSWYPSHEGQDLLEYAATYRSRAYECSKGKLFFMNHNERVAMQAGEKAWQAYLDGKHQEIVAAAQNKKD